MCAEVVMATGSALTMADCCSVLDAPIGETECLRTCRSLRGARGSCATTTVLDDRRGRLGVFLGARRADRQSQPTVSHHTKVLAEAGLIVGEKAGRWVNWSVVPGSLINSEQRSRSRGRSRL